MARMPEGPPPDPAVQKLRVRYAKRGRLRFSSHRDFQRAFERALRRSAVPTAYSAGFTPHPKVSYAGAAPTGVASEAEYLELSVTERVDPERLRDALDASLPPGLDVLAVVEAPTGALADLLQASVWEIRVPGVEPATLEAACAAFLACDRVEVQRLMKNGLRTFDAREAVLSMDVETSSRGGAVDPTPLAAPPVASPVGSKGPFSSIDGEKGALLPTSGPPTGGETRNMTHDTTAGAAAADAVGDLACAILRLVVRHVTPAVRPDDVLTGLRQVADLAPPVPPAVTRLAQGPLEESAGRVGDPFGLAQDAVGATVVSSSS